jgi:hypothetical protein
MTTQLPSVFIGSSTEGHSVAREVELQLVTYSRISLWSNGIFVLGQGTLESLMNALDDFDFAVMVLSPDDLLETRGQNFASPRDNVLFELGLFMGRLGRERTFILSEEGVDLKLPSDLAGIGRATYRRVIDRPLSVAVSPACTRIIQAIESLGRRIRVNHNENAEFSRMAEHIASYITDKGFAEKMMSFEKIREYIDSKYSDELLHEMIDRLPGKFRRARLRGGRPGLKQLQ